MVSARIYIPGMEKLKQLFISTEEELFSKKLSSELGFFAMFRIKERTSKGEDADNSPFTPYTAAYAKFRRDSGHPADKVNLFFSGSMLSAMTQMESEMGTTLFFLPTSDNTGARNDIKAIGLSKKRKFFALNEEDVKLMTGIALKYYNDLLNRFTDRS